MPIIIIYMIGKEYSIKYRCSWLYFAKMLLYEKI